MGYRGYFFGYHLSQSPPARKPLARVRKPNLHSDRGQDLNLCAWRPLGPQSTHGSTVPLLFGPEVEGVAPDRGREQLKDKGTIEEAPPTPGVYNHMFVVLKATMLFMPLIDLSILNTYIITTKFKVEMAYRQVICLGFLHFAMVLRDLTVAIFSNNTALANLNRERGTHSSLLNNENWDNQELYAFPPIPVTRKVLNKLQASGNTRLILVALFLPKKELFSEQFAVSMELPDTFPSDGTFLRQPHSH
ncbi:hypothetical protein E2C01_026069 [Portunus trituberculatus]|uniref:Uncharacterized protein n=1 Tax=Portunus trituberculatus TaxID=210409 RepID=A0A5B7EF38_PORTR|nr:hypothetical protein [Portunus trituberculatus]